MADPPPIRRPDTKPPAISPPLARVPLAPIAPPAALTDVVPADQISGLHELSDDTRNLEAPDASELVERMLELVAIEGAALLAGDDARLADLNIRTALASWDALHQPDEAVRFLELADTHPLAARLRMAVALSGNDREALVAMQGVTSEPALVLELAEAWLWRQREPKKAGELADKLLAGDLPAAWRPHVTDLAALAHTAAENWPRVLELRKQALTGESPPDEVAATAALLLDRANDAIGALAACWSLLEHFPGTEAMAPNTSVGWLRVFDLAIDAAMLSRDDRTVDLLDKRAELVSGLPGGSVEALATKMVLAGMLERSEAAALWADLANDAAAMSTGAARRMALLASAWASTGLDKLAAHRALASDPEAVECSEVVATHAWRALELAAVAGEAAVVETTVTGEATSTKAVAARGLEELARAVVDAAGGPVAERWLDAIELTKPTAQTMARYEVRGGLALRWAAAIAEVRGDVAVAAKLWRRLGSDGTGTTFDHLARIFRGKSMLASTDTQPYGVPTGDEDELAEVYKAWAASEPDPRRASALLCARGIVDLSRGDFVEAEESLHEAAELDPKDPFCRAALAAVYRAGKRYEPLAQMLAQLVGSLASPDARATAARERAELLDEHLGDPAGARAALEQMLVDRPDDPEAMAALAKLCERDRLWQRAVELRLRAVELPATTPDKRAELWLDIARNHESRGDLDAALAALDKAAGEPARRVAAMREQTRLLRAANRLDKALANLRLELATEPPLARRMQLQTEIARLLSELGQEPDAIVNAWLDVLSIEPDQTEALAGIEAPARKLGLWDELARAFRGAPQTPRNLEVLAEALEHIAEWSELVEVRRRQLEAATNAGDKASLAADLARIYEHELGDADAAIRMLGIAQTAVPDDLRQQELLRMYRAQERWADVVTALERELPTVRAGEVDRQISILLELAELRGTKLNRQPEAIQAYESVLERKPDNAIAVAALESLYGSLGRDRELARLLEARAEATVETTPRAQLFARVAQLRGNRGDVDGSLAAYAASFRADPTNREVFTAMERVCYKSERWAAAMQLYEIAIGHVESGASRAYRLGDLYARRGNVQLNFLGQVDAAIQSLQKVVEVDSQPAQAVKTLEELCKKRDDWKPLITAWEARAETQRDPQRKTDALREATKLSLEHAPPGDPRASVRLNKKLLELDPRDAAAAAQLERHYEDAQDRTGLVDVLKMRLQHARDNAESVEILKKIARASEEGARDVDTATEHYQKILELQPENRDALDALGRIYESTEQWTEFVDITRRQIKVTNDRTTKALLYFRCGSVMEAKFSREQDAIRYYDAAIKTSPACLPAVHGLRDLYRRREEWARVIETLELEVKLWEDDKERAGVFAQIGGIYEHQLGDAERAMHFYESALSVDSECLPANQALFDHFFARGEWDKAQPIAAMLAQKAMRDGDPTTRSEFYRKRGVVARATGDSRGAADSFIAALEVKPTNAEALDDLGTLAREQPDAWDFDATYRELDKLYKKRDDAQTLVARVHVGRAAIIERAGDLDQASELYRAALELAPSEFRVLSAVVDFHADMRHWGQAVAAIERFVATEAATADDKISALMRQAGIHADGEMNAMRAIAVLKQVLASEPAHQDAYYLLAQQYFLIGRHADARTAIDRVIELATAPGQPLTAEALARYYYYKGRILDAAGDQRSAAPQYRRAIEYDPGYAPPALVLARRAADSGDQRQAESLLIDAAHAAMAQGGPRAAVPLQRGLARILLASGDRPAAIEAYRGILNVEPDGASDRVALAEIYAVDDPTRAISELRKVLDRDIHHAPAYRLLASFYNRTGDTERAQRVLTALDLLGFAEESDRTTMQRMRSLRVTAPLRGTLDDDHRDKLLATPASREPLGDVFAALAEDITVTVSAPSLGVDLQPAQATGDTRLLGIADDVGRLFETEAELFVGDKVPGYAAVTAFPRRMIVIDRSLLGETDQALRFLFGYAFEAIRGNYAVLLQLGARQRRELAQLLRSLLATESTDLSGPASDLVHRATPSQSKIIERYAGTKDLDPGAWMDGMVAGAKRAGLLACDDFAAAIWMVARMSGERLASHDATVALGAVLGGPDLVRFYLSDNYQHLRDVLTVG